MRALTSQGSSDVDQVLAEGLSKLQSFGQLMSLYRDWTGSDPNGMSPDSLIDEYQQQKGMSVAALRTYAATLSDELSATLTEQAVDQQAKLPQLHALWSDSAGSAAATLAQSKLSERMATDTATLSATAKTVAAAADTLERVVSEKAATIQQDLTDTVAGLSAQQIGQLIDYAKNGFGGASTEQAAAMLRSILPEYPAGGGNDVA
ncbi:hypothetical protein [Nocardia sp. NPDC051463]|uniref:hypothetical protein n=1 Tax=Nocardia sp. NPDC051463 TaxID=3154845 RepID=UPI0034447D8A